MGQSAPPDSGPIDAAPRVAIVTTSFPRWLGDPSGHFVLADARRERARGSIVHVVAPGRAADSALDRALHREGITVHRAGGGELFGWPGVMARARERPSRLAGALSFGARAARELRALAPLDRVVAHWILPSAFPLASVHGGPLEVVAHGADVRLLLRLPGVATTAIVEALLSRGATFRFASAALRAELGRSLPVTVRERLSSRSSVEPPPLDVTSDRARAERLRERLALSKGDSLAVCVGRIVPSKRVDLAIAAAGAIPGAKLVVIGDGPALAALEASTDPRRVVFTRLVTRDRALDWIAAADVLIHPSAEEGAPSVVREARALGVPVVACRAGDVGAWAEVDPGIRVAEPTAEALATALRGSLEGPRY